MRNLPNPAPKAPASATDWTIRWIAGLFVLIIGIVVAVAGVSIRNINREIAGSDWVNHTHSVILQAEAVRSSLFLSDGDAHTFVATGDPRERAACLESLSEAGDDTEFVTALTRNEPAQRDLSAHIEVLVNRRAGFIQKLVAAKQSGDAASARSLLAEDAGQPALKEIDRAIERLKGAELELLTERDTASFLQAQTTRWTVWSGVALDFLLLAGVGWLIADDLAARRRATAALVGANERLETNVRDRTAELASANERLTAENLERSWANQGLEHQLHYNQLIINSINDLVLVLTKAMNISRVNPAVIRVTGREPHEVIHRPFSTIAQRAGAGSTPMIDPVVLAMNEGRDLRDQPMVIEDRKGRKIDARMAMFPLRDRDKVVGCVVILQETRTPDRKEP